MTTKKVGKRASAIDAKVVRTGVVGWRLAVACLSVGACGKENGASQWPPTPGAAATRASDAAVAGSGERGVQLDAASVVVAGPGQPMALPPPMAAFDALLRDLETAPPNAARAKRTCAVVTDDTKRTMFFAVWRVTPPSSVPRDEWNAATEDYLNTEYEIGDLCQDLDWDDDVAVLATLRRRFDRLAHLLRR